MSRFTGTWNGGMEQWNGGMVERWNSGMGNYMINDPVPLQTYSRDLGAHYAAQLEQSQKGDREG